MSTSSSPILSFAISSSSIWSFIISAIDHLVNGRNDWGLTGEWPFGKRTKWSMAELIKDQMLQDELAKDKMGEDEVAWYQFDVIVAKFLTKSRGGHSNIKRVSGSSKNSRN